MPQNRELQSNQLQWRYTPGDKYSQDGATVLTYPYAQFPRVLLTRKKLL